MTWLVPRLTWQGGVIGGRRGDRCAPCRRAVFWKTAAAPDDVDDVVNANAVFWLGDFPGRGRIADYLLAVLRNGEEDRCDKYYDVPVVIRYFFSRAMRLMKPPPAA